MTIYSSAQTLGGQEMGDYDLGMVGLGVMGRNLALNMADHGYGVVGYDKDSNQVQTLRFEAKDRQVLAADDLEVFIGQLRKPRAVMMLVPAGAPVDAVIRDLLPRLEKGDLIIDGGNSYFKDTDLREKTLRGKGVQYIGVGISGGSAGARHGPSMMPGGDPDAYERVRAIFEAVAAKVNGEPCVTYLGPRSAGHYVKMVHNGIEYGLIQLIAETYDLMKRGLGLDDDELQSIYARWNQAELSSYLVEITANVFGEVDPRTGHRLIDVILDEAKQKGTGKWTSQDAMELQVPVPTIDAAVAMRDLSGYKTEREAASRALAGEPRSLQAVRQQFLEQLRNALYASMIVAYAQGLALLRGASQAYDYGLNLASIARIWRGGCIIRAAVLEPIRTTFSAQPALSNLLLNPQVGQEVLTREGDLRAVVCYAIDAHLPAPALSASLAYLDGYRSAWLPANLIQAQRDYFGAHTYERVDAKGVFHTNWEQE
jgi:6-phosphogluconate dehydrogenase